jgi:1-acyl-sn-glycerol-3-phosphate acyltransferase
MAVRNMTDYVCMTALSVAMYLLVHDHILSLPQQFWFVAALAAGGAALTWWIFFREAMEQLTEILVWPFYRIRGHGPGLAQVPPHGPVLVLANHSAWFDPLWVAKVIPRRLITMMTSNFYDLPGIRWLFKHVVHAIRVQASTYRREAPELGKAIDELDKGHCVVIFPEGAMRRRENQPLKLFGQGVWHILHERPNTPVVVCWIEGGWGSYTSYWNGKPTANKRFDLWRRIDVAVSPPILLDEHLLKDHRATRTYLMRVCLEARRYLGFEPLRLEKFSEHVEAGQETESQQELPKKD